MSESKPVLLSVLAHPDDESFGMGGTLAYYAAKGCDVYLVCATRGEAGEMDEQHLGNFATTAEKREAELRCASEKLGLKQVFFLDYRDSGMAGADDNQHPDALINAPLDEVAARVVRFIRALKPDVVLTFDPIGGYHHPDHIHIQQATVLAFKSAGSAEFHPQAGEPFKPSKLYFHIFPRWFLRLMVSVMSILGKDPRKWGRNGDIDLKAIAEVQYPTHARINIRDVMHIKAEASACHASQGGAGMRRGLMGLITKIFGEKEAYMQAYPPVNGRVTVKRDLLK